MSNENEITLAREAGELLARALVLWLLVVGFLTTLFGSIWIACRIWERL